MRLAFLGTPEPSVVVLHALVGAGHDVALVVTRPDRRRGRGGSLQASPVKVAAEALGLRVAHRLDDLDGLGVELGIVVAFGALIPASVLERTPMLNVHFSLLPRWRGAAPVERAILAGDLETGVSIMTLEAELDTGPVHLERRVTVDDKSAAALTNELAHLGADALLEVLDSPSLLANPVPQTGQPTYAHKLTSSTFHLAPSMAVVEAWRTVRLGRAYCFVEARRLGVLEASPSDAHVAPGRVGVDATGVVFGVRDGSLALGRVRPEGSRTMAANEWWVGARLELADLQWS